MATFLLIPGAGGAGLVLASRGHRFSRRPATGDRDRFRRPPMPRRIRRLRRRRGRRAQPAPDRPVVVGQSMGAITAPARMLPARDGPAAGPAQRDDPRPVAWAPAIGGPIRARVPAVRPKRSLTGGTRKQTSTSSRCSSTTCPSRSSPRRSARRAPAVRPTVRRPIAHARLAGGSDAQPSAAAADRFFPPTSSNAVARSAARRQPDVIPGGHLAALSRPDGTRRSPTLVPR